MLAFAHALLKPALKWLAIKLGFVPKIKVVHKPEDASFCSQSFYPTQNNQYTPAPTAKAAGKYGILCLKQKLTTQHAKQMLRGKALGLLPYTNHVPVLREMVQKTLQETEDIKHESGANKFIQRGKREIRKKLQDMAPSRHEATDDTTRYAAETLRVSSSVLSQFENEIRSHSIFTVYNTPSSIAYGEAIKRMYG